LIVGGVRREKLPFRFHAFHRQSNGFFRTLVSSNESAPMNHFDRTTVKLQQNWIAVLRSHSCLPAMSDGVGPT
jgi:hypothetical protein